MLGETLTSAAITCTGLSGDRTHAVLDDADTIGSAKHPRKWGQLLRCRSRLTEGGTVEVELADGATFPVGDPELNAHLTKLLGRSVRLSADAPADAPLERAVPEYEGGVPDIVRASSYVDGTGEEITVGRVASGTFFDFGRIHLVSTSSLAALRAVRPDCDFDPRRFRPNLVVDTGEGHGFVEDTWVGCRVRVGEALCRVVVPTPRCVVPTLGHGDLRPDLSLMRTISREHRIPVFDLGRLACLGVYLDVLEPGMVRTGDPVTRQEGP